MLKATKEREVIWTSPWVALFAVSGALLGFTKTGALIAGMATGAGTGFLMAYVILLCLVGLPLMQAWLVLGRRAEQPATAIREAARASQLSRHWYWLEIFWQLLAFLLLVGVAASIGSASEQLLTPDGSTWAYVSGLALFLLVLMALGALGARWLGVVSAVLVGVLVLIALSVLWQNLGGENATTLANVFAWQWPTAEDWAGALALVFVSASLGGAALWTYGNYLPTRPASLAVWSVGLLGLTTLLALLAGSAAYVSSGDSWQDPISVVLLLGALLAALALLEAVVVRVTIGRLSRPLATVTVALVAGLLAALRPGDVFQTLLDNWLLPLAVLLVAVLVGWLLKETQVRKGLAIATFPFYLATRALLRLGVPLAVLAWVLHLLGIW